MMTKKSFILMGMLLVSLISLSAQKYAVHFTDKNNSPYSLDNPQEYLSQRALDRRAKFGISVTEEDFPVNPAYLAELQNVGATPFLSSRWLNCALVTADAATIELVEQLPFVEKTVFVSPESLVAKSSGVGGGDLHKPHEPKLPVSPVSAVKSDDYGYGLFQIQQLNGVGLHDLGYRGEGVLIAIIDGGFDNANNVSYLRDVFESGRVVMAKDFVHVDGNIYIPDNGSHGTSVFSCIGSNISGSFVGTAPDASFCLFNTEDGDNEYLIECYNWAIAAETADSIGADIINSSLGYSTFDVPSMDYTYAQMDGATAVSSIAAEMLVERGVIATISAGNSNGSDWPWVGTPCDAPSVITVGAVDTSGTIAYFSSIGPNAAGVQKPELLACGYNCVVAYPNSTLHYSAGTSFSSPILCGMIACLIQAFPEKTPAEIKDELIRSASRYDHPNYVYGYGIPDFMTAYETITCLKECHVTNSCNIFPNPADNYLRVSSLENIRSVTMYDCLGRVMLNQNVGSQEVEVYCQHFAQGIYLVAIELENGKIEYSKIVKQ